MGWLQTHLDEDVIITNGAGNFALWPNKVFSYGAKQRLLALSQGRWAMACLRRLRPRLHRADRWSVLPVMVISRWA